MKKITSSFPGTRILVADDYFVNHELTREMLEMMECDVDVAEDGEAALSMFKENSYDMIFMDIQMPEMDGYDATREIRKLEKTGEHIPIVAITANAMEGDKEKCIKAGMDDYICKPLKGEDLETVLSQYLEAENKAIKTLENTENETKNIERNNENQQSENRANDIKNPNAKQASENTEKPDAANTEAPPEISEEASPDTNSDENTAREQT